MKLKKISLERKGLECLLSPLESDILKIILNNKEMKVRDVHNKLKGRKKAALTSVAVILDRLYEKGFVGRKVEVGRGGPHYIYYPVADKNNIEHSIIKMTVDKLIDSFGNTAVNYFNERFSKTKRVKK